MTMNERVPAQRINILDGWRAVSILLVMISHLVSASSIKSMFAGPYLGRLDNLGDLGVQIFFVISGYVICKGIVRELETSHRVCLPAFYTRRFFKIIPPLLIYLLTIQLLVLSGVVPEDNVNSARGILFVCNFGGLCGPGWLGLHQWSLAYEEQFYLIFPVLFILMGGARGRILYDIDDNSTSYIAIIVLH